MRIVYCTESLPPLVDGVTRTLSELVGTLGETGHEFTFLSAVRPEPDLPWRDRVHTVPSVPFPLYPYYRVCLPSARTLDPVLDRFGPDIVHVVTPSLLGLYAAPPGVAHAVQTEQARRDHADDVRAEPVEHRIQGTRPWQGHPVIGIPPGRPGVDGVH